MTMVSARGEVVIARSRADVFAVLADPTRIPTWRSDIVEVKWLDGAHYREEMRFMGKQWQTFEIVDHVPSTRLVVRATAGLALRPVQRFELAEEGGGTRLRYFVELPLTGWMRIMSPLLRLMIPRKWRSYAAALRTTLES